MADKSTTVLSALQQLPARVVNPAPRPSARARGTAAREEEAISSKDEHSLDSLRVELQVDLATRKFPLAELLQLRPGRILNFSKRYDAPLAFRLGSSQVGCGRAVDLGEHLGLLIESVESTPSRPAARERRSTSANERRGSSGPAAGVP